MVRRLHTLDLEKEEIREREDRLNSLLNEGNATYGALQVLKIQINVHRFYCSSSETR